MKIGGKNILAFIVTLIGIALWSSTASGQSVSVLGFSAKVNGLHFDNDWPAAPDYTVQVFGTKIGLGSASNGLCGGMVYAVKDCFDAGVLPPADTTQPDVGTPLYTYIVARLTDTFDVDDVTTYLAWIAMNDRDTDQFGWGLAHREIAQEWPKIKSDIDAGEPSPLGLIHGQEAPGLGFFMATADLSRCHQVLAYGYDLDGAKLTIHIWDPNHPDDKSSAITLNIGDPKDTTPVSVTHYRADAFRGFFRTHYTYKDPRKPTTATLVVQAVNSPGITPAGPIPAVATTRPWLAESGSPLARFDGSGAQWSHAVIAPAADSGQPILQLMATIATGKGGPAPGAKSAGVTLGLVDGKTVSFDVTDGVRWNANEVHRIVLPLPAGTRSGDVISIKYSGGDWDVMAIGLEAFLPLARDK